MVASRSGGLGSEFGRLLLVSDPPTERRPLEGRSRETQWLRRLRDLSHRLANEQDLARVQPLILDAAIELCGAERGYLVRVASTDEGRPQLDVVAARGFDRKSLGGEEAKISRRVVERVSATGQGIVTTDAEHQALSEVTSLRLFNVLCVLAVPLRLRGQVLGALYLDHRAREDAFDAEDFPVVEAFADQAALALETAELIRERRRAAEAEARARRDLATLQAARLTPPEDNTPPSEDPVGRSGDFVGRSASVRELLEEIERAARADSPVLISAEPGAGASLAAAEIHARGVRASEPFLEVDCARNEAALEVELWGGAGPKGAPGALLLAGRGTLVLDRVEHLGDRLQRRLLRNLQRRVVKRPGARQEIPLEARLLLTTQARLRELVQAGAFRADLYFRLDVHRVALPPLRERGGDWELLARHLWARQGARRALKLTPKARALIETYPWPGNVSELEAEVATWLARDSASVSARQLSPKVRSGVAATPGSFLGKSLAEAEREQLLAALEESGGNKAAAARALGIPKSTLYYLLDRHALRE